MQRLLVINPDELANPEAPLDGGALVVVAPA